MINEALGIVETRSLVSALEAADTMVKTSSVTIIDIEFVGSGVVAVSVVGDVAAVQAAVNSGSDAARGLGEIISANVIARPHNEVDKLY